MSTNERYEKGSSEILNTKKERLELQALRTYALANYNCGYIGSPLLLMQRENQIIQKTNLKKKVK